MHYLPGVNWEQKTEFVYVPFGSQGEVHFSVWVLRTWHYYRREVGSKVGGSTKIIWGMEGGVRKVLHRAMLCYIDLRCAPLTCLVHHRPALCTIVHKGDQIFAVVQKSYASVCLDCALRDTGGVWMLELFIFRVNSETDFYDTKAW